MQACQQTAGLNVLQHGVLVSLAYSEMLKELRKGTHQEEFLQGMFPLLEPLLFEEELMSRYHVYHDCGKPFCQATEERKFPDHEARSFEQWSLIFPEDKIVANLMLNDMKFHAGNNDAEFYSSELAPSLYLTSWAELEANSSMFGGHESTSYKIKRKRLIQQGKKLRMALEVL